MDNNKQRMDCIYYVQIHDDDNITINHYYFFCHIHYNIFPLFFPFHVLLLLFEPIHIEMLVHLHLHHLHHYINYNRSSTLFVAAMRMQLTKLQSWTCFRNVFQHLGLRDLCCYRQLSGREAALHGRSPCL